MTALPPSLAKKMPFIDNQPSCKEKQDVLMLNKIRYQLLGKEESQDDVDTPNNWRYLSTRERLRLHLAGFLATLLGAFIIWRTVVLVLWLFPAEMPMNASFSWSDTRYMFVFGDSLSSIEYNVSGAYPDEKNPIGNPPYPGKTTSGGANWVGYVTTEYNDSAILAYDYAQSGGVVQWVEGQVNQLFLPHAGQKPSYAPWSGEDSLFMTWIGTNDVMQWRDIEGQLTLLFRLQETLYQAGARNFVFITVPPFDRSPIQNAKADDNLQYRIAEWNSRLRQYANAFQEQHCSLSFKIYNANGQLTDILDHPEKYGFKDEWSICHEQACVWNDGIHPTFAVHKLWAEDLTNFLKSG